MANDQWLGIELRHLAALEAVAREGSFRRAATSLGYVQSAISQQIAALERAVGQRLVERSRGGVRVELTEAGELVLQHADAILARLKAAQADVAALAAGQSRRAARRHHAVGRRAHPPGPDAAVCRSTGRTSHCVPSRRPPTSRSTTRSSAATST